MGVAFTLVNYTRRERLTFAHVAAGTKRELAGYPPAAAIATWYLLERPGDAIAFVSGSGEDWPFPAGSRGDLALYPDVTDEVIGALIGAGVLADEGRDVLDADEPDVYLRRLRNVWMD